MSAMRSLLSKLSPAIEQVAASSHVCVGGAAVVLIAFSARRLHLKIVYVHSEPAGNLCKCTTPAHSAEFLHDGMW
jgi:hypothetical protein